MANTLTGDFDVVAQFSLPAVNRVLAAMHQCERFLHSDSSNINDNPLPGSRLPRPVLVGAIDSFGDAVVNQQQMAPLSGWQMSSAFQGAVGVVNPATGEFGQGTTTPSHIQGNIQLQLFPPVADIPDASGRNISVTMNVMARYFPDPKTAPLAQFVRGDLQIIAPVNQISSEVANVVEFDFKAQEAQISFTPSYSSEPLSADDLAGINLMIRNALVTSFQPSSATLPSNVSLVQFKTLIGTQKAAAVLLNLTQHPASSSSVSNVFLGPGDDFAFAAGRDFILGVLQPIANNLLSQAFPPITLTVPLGFTTLHVTYPITLNSAGFDLQPGKIVLTIQGHASKSNHSWAGPFDFTVTMDFSLQAVGPAVNLIPGGVSLTTTSLLEELVSIFSDAATQSIKAARDQALNDSGAYDMVSNTFDVNHNLGQFVDSLLTPPSGSDASPQDLVFTYSAVDIEPDGIAVRGSAMLLFQWPSPYVEFEQIPPQPSGHHAVGGGGTGILGQGPDYTALKTWIPGGRIDQYEWSVSYQNQLYPFGVDPNKFVLLHGGAQLEAGLNAGSSLPPYTPLCLTVRGTRLSAQGPVVPQQVSGSVCGYTRVPVVPAGTLLQAGSVLPVLALTRPGAGGEVVVTGHALAQAVKAGAPGPNLILHFADAKSVTELGVLATVLHQHKKKIAVAAVAVAPANLLSKAAFVPGLIYADDRDSAWERLLGMRETRRPFTVIADPGGKVVWQHEGLLSHESLAAALRKHLVDTGAPLATSLASVNVRIGQPAPNFLFEYVPGRETTVTKMKGRQLVLVFWRSASQPSLQAIRDLQALRGKSGPNQPVVLAINDGESSDIARAVLAESGISTTLVIDPHRQIAAAYGVDLWPTIVNVDASGVISGIRYGYVAGEHAEPFAQTIAAG